MRVRRRRIPEMRERIAREAVGAALEDNELGLEMAQVIDHALHATKKSASPAPAALEC